MRAIEKNTDVRIKCFKCGNEYSMDMMRMYPNGKNLICKSCLERKPIQTQQQPKSAPEPKAQKQEESQLKEYFCKECRYNFKRAKHLAISACPYCGSGSVISKGSTARIIADAARMKGD